MADNDITPGRISPTGSQSQRNTYYYAPVRKKKKEKQKFRIGEVVHGTVLERPAPDEAVVRLSSGVFRAALKGDLRKGDSLFFKVLDTEGSLVLRVHSVSIKAGGKELSAKELLRMLDLLDNELYRNLINISKSCNSIIFRDEILTMVSILAKAETSIINHQPITDVYRAVFFLQQAGGKAEYLPEIFPAFRGPKYIYGLLSELEPKIDLLPEDYSTDLNNLYNLIRSANLSFAEAIRLFSDSELKKSLSFKKVIDDFSEQYLTINNLELQRAQSSAIHISNFLSAIKIWNSNFAEENNPEFYILPINTGSNYGILSAFLAPAREKLPANIKLDLASLAENDKAKTNLEKFEQDFNNYLNNKNLSIRLLLFSNSADNETDLTPDQSQIQLRKFSVVV